MLKIWGRKTSSNVQALMWCIGELGLEYQRIDIGHIYGGTDTSTFLEMNPNGTIPVLQDGDDAPVWETGAILRYLCNRYGSDPFWPSGLNERTKVDMWAEWGKINIALNFGSIFWQIVRTPRELQDESALQIATARFLDKLLIAEKNLQYQQFLAGNDLTLADIQFGHILYRYFNISIERPNLPALQEYYIRLAKRTTFQEHVMVSYDELRAE
ncbi:MAG: glutathione S-transferase family protein [Methyloligellaceae bacterium]